MACIRVYSLGFSLSAWGLTGDKKGVMRVSGRVLLRLEQRVEVPEAGLHVVVGRHLLKAHLDEDLPELAPHLQQQSCISAMPGR